MRIGWFIAAALLCCAQDTQLQNARKIFVAGLADKPGARQLQQALMESVRKAGPLQLVSSQDQADAVLSGDGELWVKGYAANNMRVRYVTHDARAIYTGYLSVELKDKSGKTLWSYLAAPRHAGSGDISKTLAEEVIHKLETAVGMNK